MSCWCDELPDYQCSNCIDKEYTINLTAPQIVALRAYNQILTNGTFDPNRKDHADLMSYIVNNNLKHERLHQEEL